MTDREKFRLTQIVEKLNQWTFRISLAIAMLGFAYDMTFQELVREQMMQGNLSLDGWLLFLHNNFAGDIGNAFAYAYISILAEIANLEFQESEVGDRLKKATDKITLVVPYFLAIFFIIGATDGETNQYIFKWGTPDKLDLVGAYYGIAVALVSYLKFRKKVFPRDDN